MAFDRTAFIYIMLAYISVPKFDIICLSETYLNSEIPSDGENLEIPNTTLPERITHLIVNVVESVFTIKARSHLE